MWNLQVPRVCCAADRFNSVTEVLSCKGVFAPSEPAERGAICVAACCALHGERGSGQPGAATTSRAMERGEPSEQEGYVTRRLSRPAAV